MQKPGWRLDLRLNRCLRLAIHLAATNFLALRFSLKFHQLHNTQHTKKASLQLLFSLSAHSATCPLWDTKRNRNSANKANCSLRISVQHAVTTNTLLFSISLKPYCLKKSLNFAEAPTVQRNRPSSKQRLMTMKHKLKSHFMANCTAFELNATLLPAIAMVITLHTSLTIPQFVTRSVRALDELEAVLAELQHFV